MNKKVLTLREVVEKFNLSLLSGDEQVLEREIEIGGINRAGLELAGFISDETSRKHRIVLLGGKENEYINKLPATERKDRYEKLINQDVPAIFTSIRFNEPVLVEYAKEINFPVIEANYSSNDFYNIIVSYIDNRLAPMEMVHASLINIYGLGVLIKGDSGIGKSENTLELVKKGHLFVGDDAIVLQRYVNKVIGRSDEKLKHHIEIRGIGILNLTKMYGSRTTLEVTDIDIIVNLKLADSEYFANLNRVQTEIDREEIFGIKIPAITIPVTLGRNISELIEAAVINIKLQNEGINSSELFINQIDSELKT
ncbi:HPr(Ser) kinase/phosphatase [Spiroplasma endosymbiont of Asaphidion curtum]|uniref:HPr(Ser) kinase/phosphatase n=1 Tax=Spiroplasma endosymbiont of Asaphidion curtum TaxID=3066281 RepID=UPI00313C6C73